MPIKVHYTKNKAYYQYGTKGAKYTFIPNNVISKAKALKKARLQALAIKLSGYKEKNK